MKQVVAVSFLTLALCACGGQSVQPAPQPAAPWRGDTLLAPLLDVPSITTPQLLKADSFGNRIGEVLHDRLIAIVADTTAPPRIRANALALLAERKETNIEPYEEALHARDERLRTAAIGALRGQMYLSQLAMALVKSGLNDPSPMVQIKTLEVLGEGEPELLREYIRRKTDPVRRQLATDLVLTAEERGAALVPVDSSGRLERTTANGYTIRFEPKQWWPRWSASVGELWVGAKGRTPVRVAGDVEVVNRVIPAFIDPEGKFLVYETNRTIRVRNLQTGTERTVGPGVAPRLIPLSSSFVYLRHKDTQQTSMGGTLRYDVVQQKLEGGTEIVSGELSATASTERFGNYSPVRWMRVRDRAGGFFLMGDGLPRVFQLEVMT